MTKLGALISVLLSLLFHLRVADAKPADVHPPVGQVYYLATTDLLGEELIGGATVLILNNTQDCFVCNKSEIIDDDSSYFENTEAFYSSIAESSTLGAALKRDFTLGFTLVPGSNNKIDFSKQSHRERFHTKRVIESWPLCCKAGMYL